MTTACTTDLVQIARDWQRFAHRSASMIPGVRVVSSDWLMLLELYTAQHDGRRLSVSGLSSAAGLASTTGLRHIEVLTRSGLISRDADWDDKRRTWIVLTEAGRSAVERVLKGLVSAVGQHGD